MSLAKSLFENLSTYLFSALYVECYYADCRYSECHGATVTRRINLMNKLAVSEVNLTLRLAHLIRLVM